MEDSIFNLGSHFSDVRAMKKAFYGICETEELRTLMYYFDLLTY